MSSRSNVEASATQGPGTEAAEQPLSAKAVLATALG